MRRLSIGLIALGLLTACAASVREQRAALESAARSLGATDVKSLEYTGNGVWYQVGQNKTAGQRWPRFNLPSYTRAVNYETASLRDTTVADRQMQLWTTPHGFIRAALARGGTVSGRTISLTVPGRFTARGTLNAEGLLEKVEATLPSPVVGDLPVVINYGEYKAFGAVTFPTRIRQSYGGFPSLELTVTDVKVNAPIDVTAPEPVRATHHHYDHSGGLRAFVAEGVTVIAHESSRAFYERAFASAATVDPDQLSRGSRRGAVEGVGDRRTLTDGTRVVDIHLLKDNGHADGFLMVHLPAEKLLVEADAYSPLAPNAPVPTPPSPYTVNLADNIARLRLAVDQILPIHGRMVPLAELHRTIGR